jgi:hypothetical protein
MADDKPCGPIDQVEAELAAEYQEVHIIEGITDQSPVIADLQLQGQKDVHSRARKGREQDGLPDSFRN